ncbi:MAG: C_GCAxxG_C_C family protein [Desulfobacterales bacterium]|nr:C_GCAxxG_C_C family protein [Desulfobacterales bacterium]
MEKHETAVKEFMDGYRCSQAVLAVYARDFDLDLDLARQISLPLAGGAGVGGTCGAVSGAYLVIGMQHGFAHPGDPQRLKRVIAKNRAFVERFKALHAEIDCPRLIGLDVFSEEGHRTFVEKNIKAAYCANFVADAVKILGAILAEE